MLENYVRNDHHHSILFKEIFVNNEFCEKRKFLIKPSMVRVDPKRAINSNNISETAEENLKSKQTFDTMLNTEMISQMSSHAPIPPLFWQSYLWRMKRCW
jgi:hypothetical protein